MNTNLEDSVAAQLRVAYVEKKRQLLKSHYILDDKYQSEDFWLVIARICMRLGAVPKDFIAAAFNYCKSRSGPFPNQLKSITGMARAWENFSRMYPEAETDYSSSALTSSNTGTHKMAAEDETLEIILAETFKSLYNATGSNDPATDKNLEQLRNTATFHLPWIRVIMRPDDVEIWNTWGWEVQNFFHAQTSVAQRLAQKGYAIPAILNADPPPRPSWARQLEELGLLDNYTY